MPVVRLKNPKSFDLICLFLVLNKHAMAIISAAHEEVFSLHSHRLPCAHHDIGVLGPFIGSEAAPDLPLPHPWPKRSLCATAVIGSTPAQRTNVKSCATVFCAYSGYEVDR
jgi:hypothetical protein